MGGVVRRSNQLPDLGTNVMKQMRFMIILDIVCWAALTGLLAIVGLQTAGIITFQSTVLGAILVTAGAVLAYLTLPGRVRQLRELAAEEREVQRQFEFAREYMQEHGTEIGWGELPEEVRDQMIEDGVPLEGEMRVLDFGGDPEAARSFLEQIGVPQESIDATLARAAEARDADDARPDSDDEPRGRDDV